MKNLIEGTGVCIRVQMRRSCHAPYTRVKILHQCNAALCNHPAVKPRIPRTTQSPDRMYVSIAALNAAKPAHPSAAACGPAFAPNAPPVMHPAATPFVTSFFARSCILVSHSMSTRGFASHPEKSSHTPSIPHSVKAKIIPTVPKPLADERLL